MPRRWTRISARITSGIGERQIMRYEVSAALES